MIYWKDIASWFVWYFVDFFTKDSKGPILGMNDCLYRNSLKDIIDNFKVIQEEILASQSYASSIQGDEFFEKDITDDGKWKKIYLKWYAPAPPYAYKLFPKTLAILDRHSDIRLVMISKLEQGAYIKPHRGVYRGSLRVHVGIQTPNSPECSITIGGYHYWWKDGEMVVFDDTYEHSVRNNTTQSRLILFLDIDRRMKYSWAQSILTWITLHLCSKTTRKNEELNEL